jgi:hypothetical protein
MRTSSWASAGTITRAADLQRKADLKRQRELEREGRRGGFPLHALGDRDDEPEDLPDAPPRGWCGR